MSHLEGVSYTIFAVYLLCFLALSAVAGKQAGRRIWLFGEGTASQRVSAVLLVVSFALSAVWPIVHALGLDPIIGDPVHRVLDGIVADLIGHFLVGAGALIAMMSQMHMGESWRIGAAEGQVGEIVDTGPFAISRNPVFVGQLMLLTGLFLVFPGVVQAILLMVLFMAINAQVRVEERVLAATLGEPYGAYKKRVRRWLGTVG